MKTISYKVSLETFKSRTPSVVPAISTVWYIPSLTTEKFRRYDDAKKYAEDRSCSTSLIVGNDEFVDFSTGNTTNLYDFNGNYGLIPSDIEIPSEYIDKITDYTDILINIPVLSSSSEVYTIERLSKKYINNNAVVGDEFYYIYDRNIYSIEWSEAYANTDFNSLVILSVKHKYLTYRTLKKWYLFFREYYDLLHDKNSKIEYSSAVEYCNINYPSFDSLTLSKYKEMDDLYESRGGNEFYEWICKNCFVKFIIPFEYVDGWGTNYLFLPEFMKQFGWMQKMCQYVNDGEEITELTEEDCSSYENCEECITYVRRGGLEMTNLMSEWYDELSIKDSYTSSASFTIPLLLESSIDDMGEMSIFSTGWNEKVDYHSTLSSNERMNGGTVVHSPYTYDDEGLRIYDKKSYIIKDSTNNKINITYKGYNTNQYKENYFESDDWEDYTYKYMSENPEEFVASVTSYTFDRSGNTVYEPTDSKMTESYSVKTFDNGVININGKPYEVFLRKYVVYHSNNDGSLLEGKVFVVNEDSDGNYYCVVNSKKYYAYQLKKTSGITQYFFDFDKKSDCYNGQSNSPMLPLGKNAYAKCIRYNGVTQFLTTSNYIDTNTKTTVNGTSNCAVIGYDDMNVRRFYPILYGYVDIDNVRYWIDKDRNISTYLEEKQTFFYQGGEDVDAEGFAVNSDDAIYAYLYGLGDFEADFRIYDIDKENNAIKVVYPYTIYNCEEVSGKCDSRLSLLKSKQLTYDDLGNEMSGYYGFEINEYESLFYDSYMTEIYRTNSKNTQPYNGCRLDLLYKVGNVSNLSKNEDLTIDDSTNYQIYDGNLLQTMRIYCVTDDGVEIPDTEVILDNDILSLDVEYTYVDSDNNSVTSSATIANTNVLKAIELSLENADASYAFSASTFTAKGGMSYQLRMDVTYYIGATLRQRISGDSETGLVLYGYELADEYDKGVKYEETFNVVDSLCTYYLYDNTSYALKYYDLQNINQREFTLDSYNAKKISNDATFSYKINIFGKDGDRIVPLNKEYSETEGLDVYNGLMASPVFRKPWQFGLSCQQNVNSGIYIDRGINRALDKHLKLQEIKSLNALEMYSNGSTFKINED